MSSSRRKLILDCDVGPDDAQALMMALSQPDIKLVAVTSVFGNSTVEHTSKNCIRILKFMNSLDVPVYKGCAKGLLGDVPVITCYNGKDSLSDIHIEGVDPVDTSLLQTEPAAVALVRLINENPGEITLVATGPLTNVALALHLDPDLGKKLRGLYVMGGNSEGRGNVTPSAEFNFYCDPEAAYFVLNNIQIVVNLCCMEPCERHGFSWEWYEKFTSHGTAASRLIRDFEHDLVTRKKQRGTFKNYTMVWDQFTMAVAIKEDLSKEIEDVYATVEVQATHTRGRLIIDRKRHLNKPPNVRLIQKIDQNNFEKLMQTIVQ